MQTTVSRSKCMESVNLHGLMDSVSELKGILSEQDITDLLDDMCAHLLSSDSLSQPVGLTAREQEAFYHQANGFYQQRSYLKAMEMFVLLLREDPAESRYYKGIAACYQMLGEHEKAVGYHGFGYILDVRDPAPFFHMGQCLLAAGRNDDAIDAFQVFIDETKEITSCDAMRQHAQEILSVTSALA